MTKRTAASGPRLRNATLFVAGLAGIAYETVFRRPPDYGLLPVFAGMVGLPWFVQKDTSGADAPPAEPKEQAHDA